MVDESAERPAINKQDFTWALATGIVYFIPLRFPPLIAKGAKELSFLPKIVAPISVKGSITHPIGLLLRDASPLKTEKMSALANNPDINLIEVPLLPASNM